MNIYIATSRSIGLVCIDIAKKLIGDNHPLGWKLIDTPDQADVFISVMYEHLISEEYINRPDRRCYNFHPGILPEYRGSGAFSWSIINGEKQCGISLHELDVNIDTGPIIDIHRYTIEGWDTAKSLYDRGMAEIERMFHKWFPRLITKEYTAYPQDESKAHTYYRKDLEKVRDLTRYVRAFGFPGKPSAFYKDRLGNSHELGL